MSVSDFLFVLVIILLVIAAGYVAFSAVMLDSSQPDEQVFLCGEDGGVVFEWRTFSFLKDDITRSMTDEEYQVYCMEE